MSHLLISGTVAVVQLASSYQHSFDLQIRGVAASDFFENVGQMEGKYGKKCRNTICIDYA